MHEFILAASFLAALGAVATITVLQAREWMKAFLLLSDIQERLLKHMEDNASIGGQPIKLFMMERDAAEKREAAERDMEMQIQKMRAERVTSAKPAAFDPRS